MVQVQCQIDSHFEIGTTSPLFEGLTILYWLTNGNSGIVVNIIPVLVLNSSSEFLAHVRPINELIKLAYLLLGRLARK